VQLPTRRATIATTAAALKAQVAPFITVSVDVAWSPECIDLRCYDYAGIAAAADLLFVMAYDMRSQVFWPAPCVASANAPLPLTLAGMGAWTGLNVSVDPSKLVLGVPWYGYIYECIDDTAPDAANCPIERVTWRGVNCSDAVGSEHNYFELVELLRHNATRPRDYNESLQAPFFNFVNSAGVTSQVWCVRYYFS
jgi:di-N-acetylchitobiase